jgi:hypothetical protein
MPGEPTVIACSWPCAFVRAIPKIGAPEMATNAFVDRSGSMRYNPLRSEES